MKIIIDSILGLKRKAISKLDYDQEYDFAVWGNAIFEFSTGRETFMGFYFSEFYRVLKRFLNSEVEEFGYYDVDDYGEDYRENNQPFIKIKQFDADIQISFRWIDNLYTVSKQELFDCFFDFENNLLDLIEKKGKIEKSKALKYFNL